MYEGKLQIKSITFRSELTPILSRNGIQQSTTHSTTGNFHFWIQFYGKCVKTESYLSYVSLELFLYFLFSNGFSMVIKASVSEGALGVLQKTVKEFDYSAAGDWCVQTQSNTERIMTEHVKWSPKNWSSLKHPLHNRGISSRSLLHTLLASCLQLTFFVTVEINTE